MSSHDDDPPDGEEDPSHPAQGASAPSLPADDSPEKEPRPRVTAASIEAYLSREDTYERLRVVVAGALGRRANRNLVDILVSDTCAAALATDERAATEEDIPAWAAGVARNMVRERFAFERREAKFFERLASILVPGVFTPVDTTPNWVLSDWLRGQVKDDATHRETYEMICYRAKSKKTLAQIARERGTTEGALQQRIHRLVTKYRSRFEDHKRERNRFFLFMRLPQIAFGLVVFAIIAAVVYMFLHRNPPLTVRPDDTPPPPSATASAPPPEPFMPLRLGLLPAYLRDPRLRSLTPPSRASAPNAISAGGMPSFRVSTVLQPQPPPPPVSPLPPSLEPSPGMAPSAWPESIGDVASNPDPESITVPESSELPESTVVPESAFVPESGVPESALVPESGVPESAVPESGVPESGVPESGVPASVGFVTHVLFVHVWFTVHVPHATMPPHPSAIVPQLCPAPQVVFAVHPHVSGLPPPPHVWGATHVPHVSIPPQPSACVPQV